MFKADIVNSIAAKTGNTKVAAEIFVGSFIETIEESLKKAKM